MKPVKFGIVRPSFAVVALALLAGCGAEQEELTQWMEQQRREDAVANRARHAHDSSL